MLASFEPFDATMAREILARRKKDDENVTAIETEMKRLDGLLQEARVEASQQGLVTDCQRILTETTTAFDELLSAQSARLMETLASLEAKCDVIERRFADEKAKIQVQIDDDSLSRLLDQFQRSFDDEKQDRIAREGALLQDLQDHEDTVADNFQMERVQRESISRVRKELSHVIASRRQAQDNLDTMCKIEIARIEDELSKEIVERELMDDKIIKALHQYTDKLQSSLKIVC